MKQTMLIADGDVGLCDLYREFATDCGYAVETSSDGLDCVRKLRRATPDVLVLDLELHWGGGDGVLGWLHEEPQFLPSRVILTSAAALAHNIDNLALPPVVKILTKPFPLSVLLDGPANVASDESTHPSKGGQRRGILVVDDEAALRDILQDHLQHQGFQVWTAANGDEALDHCCNHSDEIAVILLDVQMPGLDGPVCFMTGDPGDYEPSDLLRRGGRYLFGKPFHMADVVRVVCDLANEPMGWPQEE